MNEWLGYDPVRTKRLGSSPVEVGAGPILMNMARFEPGQPFFVILVLNELEPARSKAPPGLTSERAKEHWTEFASRFSFVREIEFRPNVDFDIGAYDHGLRVLRREAFDGDVLFMNSSLRGPHADDWLARYHTLFHEREDIGLCGVTLNAMSVSDGTPELPHVQSFFLYSSMRVLGNVFPQGLFEGELKSKKEAIELGEIAISEAVLRHGYAIRCAAYPDFVYKQGGKWEIPLVFGWRRDPELADKYANTIL
jgi:hypothetical protein